MKTSVKVELSGCVLARITVDVEIETATEIGWQAADRASIERAAKAKALGLVNDLGAWRLVTPVESIHVDDVYTSEDDRLTTTWRERNRKVEQHGDA